VNPLAGAIDQVLAAQAASEKPVGIILSGHNGSGKSSMWRKHMSSRLQISLINADRMMLSILPEPDSRGHLTEWAAALRDTDHSWMRVAQKGVQAFVAQAMPQKVPFAMETVFSYWEPRPNGGHDPTIQLIEQLQQAGMPLLCFRTVLRPHENVMRGRDARDLGQASRGTPAHQPMRCGSKGSPFSSYRDKDWLGQLLLRTRRSRSQLAPILL
jgi:predicted ABC-type ATPase